MTMQRRDEITVRKESLYRLAYIIPVTLIFVYFSKCMVFGPSTIWLRGVFVSEEFQISFQDDSGQTFLTGQCGFSRYTQAHAPVDYCRFQQHRDGTGCLEERNNQQVKVSTLDSEEDGVVCHKVQRKGLRCVSQLVKDCYNLDADHWYGGFEAFKQYWPMRKAVPQTEEIAMFTEDDNDDGTDTGDVELPFGPYTSGDASIHKTNLLNVLDRFFFSSNGVAIIVSEESPLHISFNQHGDGQLCLAAMHDPAYYVNLAGKLPKLEYRVCKAKDVKSIHKYVQSHVRQRPEGIPNENLFKSPIWTTWAKYKKGINQTAVLKFAEKIVSSKLQHSQLEIDDGWTRQYGDHNFDLAKFPDAKKMIAELTNLGFPVTLWIHPFFSLKSEAFKEAVENRFTVMSKTSDVPVLTRWWNEDMAAILDVTNPAAVLWFKNKLQQLTQMYNVTSFKFDAGESLFIPSSHNTYGKMESINQYSTLWAELAYTTDSDLRRQEVRVGWNSQKLPIAVRMMDKMSTWDHNGGLQSIIPSALTFSVLGYPFILPDMIGGNAYEDINDVSKQGQFPDQELYIRWLQTSLFMPLLQFSIPPWNYGEEVVTLTQKLLKLRETFASKFIALAKESVETGNPIIRPLWWLEPSDEQALTVDDEFLVGDDLLVAPVVVKGARKRDIYIPSGVWSDKLKGRNIEGPIVLKDYSVSLYQLPYFERSK